MSTDLVKKEIYEILKFHDKSPAHDLALETIEKEIEEALVEKNLCREARATLELDDFDRVIVDVECDGVLYTTVLETKLVIDSKALNLEDIVIEEDP
jgi:hypothetical protein